jgi:hypothetical protein
MNIEILNISTRQVKILWFDGDPIPIELLDITRGLQNTQWSINSQPPALRRAKYALTTTSRC